MYLKHIYPQICLISADVFSVVQRHKLIKRLGYMLGQTSCTSCLFCMFLMACLSSLPLPTYSVALQFSFQGLSLSKQMDSTPETSIITIRLTEPLLPQRPLTEVAQLSTIVYLL